MDEVGPNVLGTILAEIKGTGMSMLDNITPLFILGLPRTGTTLVQSLLDGHPQLLVDVADSGFFTRYYRRSRGKSFRRKVQLAEKLMIAHIFNKESHYYQDFLSHISIREIKAQFQAFVRESNKTPKDFMESYILALGLASETLMDETLYWVDKSPSSAFYMNQRTSWWPSAMYIHVLRDPRDLYASYKQRDIRARRKVTSIDALAYSWSKSATVLVKYKKVIGDDRYFVLRYEDLVNDFENSLSQLIHFLGIQDLEILHVPTKGHGRVRWRGNPADGKKQRGIYTSAYQKWKAHLSSEEVKCIEGMLYHDMKSSGYQPVNDFELLPHYPFLKMKNHLRELKFRMAHIGF